MASSEGGGRGTGRRRRTANLVLKEGFLYKKGGIIKSWTRRYFILNKQSLCYFRREQEDGSADNLQPLGRIFLSDIVTIETDGVEKRKAFVFALHTKKRSVLLQAANVDDRESWVTAIRRALESEGEAERKDPFRRTLRKLAPGLKRISLVKDPEKGIGCTIKCAAGHVFVNRIIEDGPIALTGVLRPGDEFVDIHGQSVSGMTVAQVAEVIRAAPEVVIATVRPITVLKKFQQSDTSRSHYSTILPQATPTTPSIGTKALSTTVHSSPPATPVPHDADLDDVGNYDDEDDGDAPPPLPPRTEDALILVDPPPLGGAPKLPPRLSEFPSFHSNASQAGRLAVRGRLLKSKSQGDSIDDESPIAGAHPTEPSHCHLYEEVQPKLTYVDIDLTPHRRRQDRTGKR